ncbi:MAG: hypothetical protein QN152_13610 [Armatimonadota bacterium]|nr:hypothetical protein [Armatimonadota bacterium]MDR7471010.1 hypothetical protein [Armatimonadota bacterium]MDR7476079.1 hypothetical protein [Armatimonadota bacterium]MDR7540541.1 hypothetical protein [Armatimonadota bacterium]
MPDARVDRLEAALGRLAEAQRVTEQRLAQLIERVDQFALHATQLTERVDQLALHVTQLTERVDQLALHLAQLTERVDRLTIRVDRLGDEVGQLRGNELERRYRERAHAYFDDLLSDIHVPSMQDLAAVLDRALAAGTLSRQERRDVLEADLVVRGRRWEDREVAYLAVEVSTVVDEGDVERAVRRAGLLHRAIGAPVLPVVAGEAITPQAKDHARSRGVWRLLDGRASSPRE